jgi:hypothetical protein
MTGYDLDGTVSTGKYKPKYEDVIITGNTPADFAHVMIVMKKNKVACPVYFNPYMHTVSEAARWKSEIINKLNITKFYENEQPQVDYIKENSPFCTVIKV